LVDGSKSQVNDAVFAEVNWHGLPQPMRSVRTARYKYIRRLMTRAGSDNCDSSVSRTYLKEHGWDTRKQDREMLFDLVFDPQESGNVAGDPAYSEALAEMRGRLDAWMQSTNDPALTGRIDPKPGMVISGGRKDDGEVTTIPAEPILLAD